MPEPVVNVPMCESCARQLWPHLEAPALDERVFIEGVARKLEQCATCRKHAQRLRAAARRSGTDVFWAWVESL
jgi:hypothetical protein